MNLPIKTSVYFTFFLIFLFSSLGFLSIDIYLPSLPKITEVFSVSQAWAQYTVTSFLITFCVMQIFYGYLSDYYGRRRILLIGIGIYIIGSLICIVATHIDTFIIGRTIQGTGIAASAVLSKVLMRDIFSGKKLVKMMSYQGMSVVTILTLCPALGGFLQEHFGYQSNFIFMMIFGGLLFLLLLFFLPETNQHRLSQQISFKAVLSSYFTFLKNYHFIACVVSTGFTLAILTIYSMVNPFLLQTLLGFSPATYGWLAMLIAFFEIVGAFANSQLTAHFHTVDLLKSGIIIMLFASVMLLILQVFVSLTVWTLLLPIFVIAFCSGMIFPNAGSGAMSDLHSEIGTAGSVYGFVQMLITAITASIAAKLDLRSATSLAACILSISIINLLVCSKLKAKSS